MNNGSSRQTRKYPRRSEIVNLSSEIYGLLSEHKAKVNTSDHWPLRFMDVLCNLKYCLYSFYSLWVSCFMP